MSDNRKLRLRLQVREGTDREWSTLNQLDGEEDQRANFLKELNAFRDRWVACRVFNNPVFRIV